MKKVDMTIQSGVTRVLHTAGKYCDRDIVVTAEKGDGYDNGYNEGLEAGKKAEYDRFWDTWQQNGNRTSYIACFAGQAWTDELYNPKYPINATANAGEMFKYAQITSTKVPIVTDLGYTTSVFQGCTKLKTIPSLKVTEQNQTFSVWFNDCRELEEINFTEDSVIAKSISFFQSPLLNTASVNGIINSLKDLTGATAQTITFHATVGGNMTEVQKTTISQKNWQLVY